jgi:ubiquinone biosynthesis protein
MVPEEFAQFRPLVSDALVFFLERLSVPRLAELVTKEYELPPNASAEERSTDLISQCPTLHKLGQIVAWDRRLSWELRQRLHTLEAMEPTIPRSVATQAVEREIGKMRAAHRLAILDWSLVGTWASASANTRRRSCSAL